MHDKISAMFEGLGLRPEDVIKLADQDMGLADARRVSSPFPISGRYWKYIPFMEKLTSLQAWYKCRITVIVEYFIALAETMDNYDGVLCDNKIIPFPLTEAMKEALRSIAPHLSFWQIAQIEFIERRSDHDLAAITDWIKFIADQMGIFDCALAGGTELAAPGNCFDGFHFGRTSEDVNSPVFALINRDLFFKHLIPEVIAFQEALIRYACEHNRVTAGLTHGQPAEPTTIGKQLMNTVAAIDTVLLRVFLPRDENGTQGTISFPVKTFGAVGNHSDLRAVYPEINWIENDRRFVDALGPGLHLDMMVTQASLFGEYKLIYDAVCTIAHHILKFTKDFWGWTSFQWFKKTPRRGVKGSSVMPNKYNPWRMEGASKVLGKFIVQLEYTASALMDYPYEGDMGRSIIMRDIGDDFAKFFIALGRITEELQLYEVNEEKIDAFLRWNPGLVAGAAQTVLKCAGTTGDAYRAIQQVMINPDGSYVSQEQFEDGMETMVRKEVVSPEVAADILRLADPRNNTGYANKLAHSALGQAELTIRTLKEAYGID